MEMPEFEKIVLIHDGKTGKQVKGKRIKHKALGECFVEIDDSNPNWSKVIMQPKAWKEIE